MANQYPVASFYSIMHIIIVVMANLYRAVYFYCIVRDFHMMPNIVVFADSSVAMKIRTTKMST